MDSTRTEQPLTIEKKETLFTFHRSIQEDLQDDQLEDRQDTDKNGKSSISCEEYTVNADITTTTTVYDYQASRRLQTTTKDNDYDVYPCTVYTMADMTKYGFKKLGLDNYTSWSRSMHGLLATKDYLGALNNPEDENSEKAKGLITLCVQECHQGLLTLAARRTSTKHQHWPLGGAVMHCC